MKAVFPWGSYLEGVEFFLDFLDYHLHEGRREMTRFFVSMLFQLSSSKKLEGVVQVWRFVISNRILAVFEKSCSKFEYVVPECIISVLSWELFTQIHNSNRFSTENSLLDFAWL